MGSRRAMKKRITAAVIGAGVVLLGTQLWSLRRSLVTGWDIWRAGRAQPSALAVLQRKRLDALVAFARTHSAYYHALYRDLPEGPIDLAALPAVTKPDLMAHFDEWVTDPQVIRAGVEAFVADPATIGEQFLGRYTIWTTSGTTGRPGIFVHDREGIRLYYTLGILRSAAIMGLVSWRQVKRVLRRGSRNALLAATGGHFASTGETERLRRLSRWLANSGRIFSVLQPLPALVRELNAFQPSRIGGYPTALLLLADEQLAGRLHVQPTMLTPSGESLSVVSRKKLERIFACPVRMVYSASEFMGIGYECEYGWLHISADWVILEPVDANCRAVPPGRPSHTVLLTNLANRVQPLIRYDLGDSITLRAGSEPCPCGCPLPAIRVEGRKGDILQLQVPTGACVAVLPLALGTVLEETPGVRRAQVIQTGPSTLTVRLETAEGAGLAVPVEVWEDMERRLRDYLAAQGAAVVTIVRSPEPPRQDPVSGKFRQVWSEMRPSESASRDVPVST